MSKNALLKFHKKIPNVLFQSVWTILNDTLARVPDRTALGEFNSVKRESLQFKIFVDLT